MNLIEWHKPVGVYLFWSAPEWLLITPEGHLYLGECDISEVIEEYDMAVKRALA